MRCKGLLGAFLIGALLLAVSFSATTIASARTFRDLADPAIPLGQTFCMGIACRYERSFNKSAHDVVCDGDVCLSDRFFYTKSFITTLVFTGYCTGIGCYPDYRYALARRAALDNPDIVPYLIRRWAQASRAGQLYIALVVRVHDRDKGDALLHQLASREGELISTRFGCVYSSAKLDEFVQSYIGRPDFKFEPGLSRSP